MPSRVQAVLAEWYRDILHAKTPEKQRRKKTFRQDRKKQELRQISDVTHTRQQHRYGRDKLELPADMPYCFQDTHRVRDMIDEYAKALLPGRSRGFLRGFAEAFGDARAAPLQQWAERKGLDPAPLLRGQRRFLARAYFPEDLWRRVRGHLQGDPAAFRRIVALMQDNELRRELLAATDDRAAVDRYLNNRLADIGGEVGAELQADLPPGVDLSREPNFNRCLLRLFHSMKKAEEGRSGPTRDLKKLRIPAGIDRRSLPAEYEALVRPERASVALRHALQMYTSGLNLIAKGFKERNESFIARGYAFVFNIRSPGFEQHVRESKRGRGRGRRRGRGGRGKKPKLRDVCPLFRGESTAEFVCEEFRKKTSAASALLLAYMEIMDALVSPEPPLMTRRSMRVREFYVEEGGELGLYEAADYPDWSPEKKRAFREAYRRFVLRYSNVGFALTSRVGPHGMKLLNLDDWGRGSIVVNPFRVREDTYLYRLLGAFRLEPNRLGLGDRARELWARHVVRPGYDPDYAALFPDDMEYLPRPVFSVNEHGHGVRSPGLYFNVSSLSAHGPARAAAFRAAVNGLSWERYAQLMVMDQDEEDPDPGLPATNLRHGIDTVETPAEIPMPRAALALLDVHANFRTEATPRMFYRPPSLPELPYLFSHDVPGMRQYLLYRPGPGKMGIVRNGRGWDYWRAQRGAYAQPFAQDPLTSYTTEDGVVPRELTERPPPLFHRLAHPVTGERIPISQYRRAEPQEGCQSLEDRPLLELLHCLRDDLPPWLDRSAGQPDDAFAYPLLTLAGDLGANVFPVGETESKHGGPPYRIVPTEATVLLPRRPQFWDLRNSLAQLLRSSEAMYANLTRAQEALQAYLRVAP